MVWREKHELMLLQDYCTLEDLRGSDGLRGLTVQPTNQPIQKTEVYGQFLNTEDVLDVQAI